MTFAPPWPDAGRARGMPGWAWWLALLSVIGTLVVAGWIPATALLAVLLFQRVRPLDFITAFLLVAGAASVVNYSAGQLTAQLSLLTVGLLYMLFCYVLQRGRSSISVPHTDLTRPMLLYAGLTLFNFIRGLV